MTFGATDISRSASIITVTCTYQQHKHWKEALSILKLAVSRSSQLAAPVSAPALLQGGKHPFFCF